MIKIHYLLHSVLLVLVLGVGLILVVLHVDGVLPLTVQGVLVHANWKENHVHVMKNILIAD